MVSLNINSTHDTWHQLGILHIDFNSTIGKIYVFLAHSYSAFPCAKYFEVCALIRWDRHFFREN